MCFIVDPCSAVQALEKNCQLSKRLLGVFRNLWLSGVVSSSRLSPLLGWLGNGGAHVDLVVKTKGLAADMEKKSVYTETPKAK